MRAGSVKVTRCGKKCIAGRNPTVSPLCFQKKYMTSWKKPAIHGRIALEFPTNDKMSTNTYSFATCQQRGLVRLAVVHSERLCLFTAMIVS